MASLALMVVVTAQLARAALVGAPTVVFAAAALLALVRFKVNSTWLILAGATSGFVLHAFGLSTQ